MTILVSGATVTMRRMGRVDHLGVLFNPRSIDYTKQQIHGLPWAADNGGFKGVNVVAYERMLDVLHLRRLPGCLFVVAPDALADAQRTTRLFAQWQPRLARYGWPIAYVAQDGLTVECTPWEDFDVLFLGGTTRFKLGAGAQSLCGYAKARGKRVHVGRVNSALRARLFSDVADSVDGTATSMYSEVYIPQMLAAAALPPVRRDLQRELPW